MSDLDSGRLGPCVVDPAFHVCLGDALATPGLVEEFDRLYGFKLSVGPCADGVKAFAEFVRDNVYSRLPDHVLAEIRARAPSLPPSSETRR